MNRIYAIGAAAIAGLFLLGTLFFTFRADPQAQFAECRSSTVAGDIGGPFELVNGRGETVTDSDVITEPSLLYFGYTYCPDICPLDVVRNAEAVELLEERGIEIQPVFITVDPARDTVEVVREYADAMHPRMVGLTGSEAQVSQASAAYKTYFKRHPAVDGEYLVDHSTFSYLVLPEQGFVDYFRRDLSPEDLAERMACYVG
jgi:protein SCO1/2